MNPRDALNNPLFKGDLVLLLWNNISLRAIVYDIENATAAIKITFMLMPHVELLPPDNQLMPNVYKLVRPPDFKVPENKAGTTVIGPTGLWWP